jgi:hypothetical protein
VRYCGAVLPHRFQLYLSFFRKFSVKKSAEELRDIHPLKDGFGLFEERGDENSFISLVFMDFFRCSFQKLHTVENPIRNINVIVNKADLTTFLLNGEESKRICKIIEKKITIKDEVEISFYPSCFHDKYVYGLKWNTDGIRVSLLFTYLIL